MQNSRKPTFSIGLIAVMFFFLFDANVSTAHPDPDSDHLIEGVDEYIMPMVQKGEFSGTVLLAQNGKVILSRAYGQANIEQGTKNTLETTYRIGSLTKQFTAMAILILQDRGRLKVSDSVCNYVVDCPSSWRDITIHHLLSHTSGIIDYTKLPDAKRYRKELATSEQIIDTFKEKPLEFAPGTNWNYSNSGYYLLGVIIEKVSGQSYAMFLENNIFKPLRMTNTGYGTPQAAGYLRKDDYLMEWHPENNANFTYAAGALYSTVGDLLRWEQALYPDRLLNNRTLSLMFQGQTGRTLAKRGEMLELRFQAEAVAYGYGWFLADRNGNKIAFHAGRLPGYSSYIERSLDGRTCIIILSNIRAPLQKIIERLEKIAYSGPQSVLKKHP